jgi:nicotinate-nucleotide--dimethylbenzimidazole phosphoribosyltransferase
MSTLNELLRDLPESDHEARAEVEARAASVLRPRSALARLDDVAAWLAGWQRTARPDVRSPRAIIFVADHGVAARDVSAYPQPVTASMLEALESGVATASVLARRLDVALQIVDVGVGRPTGDITVEPALDHDRFEQCLAAGRAAVAASEADLIVLGEMGIANTTPAAAVCATLFGLTAADWTGRGTGVDTAGYERKIAAVEAARRRVQDASTLDVLREVGGAELVAISGACLEARHRSIPVLLDGFVVTAALAPLEVAQPGALDHCLAGHCSSEPGHRLLLEKLGKPPLLDLDLRLGEGSGALLALPLVKLAAAAVTDVATFSEWGLTEPE